MEGQEQTFESTRDAAYAVVQYSTESAAKGSRETALIVALYGDLGAGKTSFTQAAAEAFGITERVISPTFVLERIYDLPAFAQPFTHFIHIDAYRLEGGAELAQLGWEDIVTHPENIIFIEWADKIEDALPEDAIKVRFAFNGETGRKIQIENF